MHAPLRLRLVAGLAMLADGVSACTNAGISAHRAEFAALDPATQHAIRAGEVRPGFSTDMVTMALGRPAAIRTDAQGRTIWEYPREPLTAPNETIVNGYRRRVVYDPVKRTNDITMEPIDAKAFPNLVPHLVRVTFGNGRVVDVTSTPVR